VECKACLSIFTADLVRIMSKSGGLLGIDVAYFIALIGTMLSGNLFIVGYRTTMLSHEDYYVILDFFPALFFFLNGLTVALTMRDRRVSTRRLMAYLGKRGTVLLLVGIVFMKSWPMNLYIACGLMFIIGPFIAQWNNAILRGFMLLLAVFAFFIINADTRTMPEYGPLNLQGSQVKDFAAFLFFNGYYSLLPWFIFFIAGMVYGRGDVRPKGMVPPTSFFGIGFMILALFVNQYCKGIYSHDFQGSSLQLFPFSIKMYLPAFVLFMFGLLTVFVNTIIYVMRNGMPLFPKQTKLVQGIAGAKYSIFGVQLIIGLIITSTFNLVNFMDKAVIIPVAFASVFCSVFLIYLWKKKINETGPMELLIKRVSGSARKA
jgi:hypothetical protein